MATNKRKQDEKHLKMLREMVALPHNKQCFDCHQRGPTYVDMTIGSYVCTSCSGILRGLNPPHRVKSISMASFTPEEMEFMRSRGNDFCRKTFLGLYDSRSHSEPSSKDEHKVREFMAQKYEKRRWFVAPTESMHEEARKMNTPETSKKDTKPLKTLVGNSLPTLTVQASQARQPPAASTPPAAPKQPAANAAPVPPPQQPATTKSGAVNLLSDLGGDPFSSAPAPAQTGGSSGGFANFANFSSQPVPAQQQPAPPPQQPVPTQLPVQQTHAPPPGFSGGPGGLLQPTSSGSGPAPAPASGGALFDAFSSTSASQPANVGTMSSGGDRYAALADIESAMTATSTPNTAAINWDSGGVGSGGIQWNSSMGGAPSTGSTGGGIYWGGGATSTAVSQNSSGSILGGLGQPAPSSKPSASTDDWPFGPPPAVSSTNPFVTNTAANPFGGAPAQPPVQSTAPVANPFFGGGAPGMQAGGFGQNPPAAGFGQNPAGTGFAQFGQAPASQTAPTSMGGFGMQNGGWGATSSQSTGTGAGLFGQQTQGFPSQGQMNKPAQPAGMFGGAPQQMGGWGTQPVANPFMGAPNSQGIPPSSNPTNPFL